jgi:3-oxoacyl-[acyl-carrier protein] reductase
LSIAPSFHTIRLLSGLLMSAANSVNVRHKALPQYTMQLTGKTIVITGAAQGIGRALALAFADAGSNLALLDTNLDKLRETAELVQSKAVTALTIAANVADEDEVSAAVDRVARQFGRLDGLVNNAGIVRDALLLKVRDGTVVSRMSLDQWRAVIDVNLTGVFLCGRAAAERMVQLRNGGVIVNISSASRYGYAGQSNYSAAKAGVAAMTEVWAKELAPYGIRTGSVAPGFIRTDILASMRPEVLDKVLASVPLKRLGESAEVSQAVRFIFENEFFTGRCIDLDGGLRF